MANKKKNTAQGYEVESDLAIKQEEEQNLLPFFML